MLLKSPVDDETLPALDRQLLSQRRRQDKARFGVESAFKFAEQGHHRRVSVKSGRFGGRRRRTARRLTQSPCDGAVAEKAENRRCRW